MKQLHDISAEIYIPIESKLVMVSGLGGRPLDLSTVVRVKRSTADVLLMRTPLPFEMKSFYVDFYSFSLLPSTKLCIA